MRSKTRYAFRSGERLYEVFSISELSDESLILFVKKSTNYEDLAGGKNIAIRETHHSIHSSKDSTGTTIKCTYLLGDETKRTFASFIQNSKQNLLAHVLSFRVPMPADRYLCQPKARDKVLTIATFGKYDHACLMYHVLVCDRDFSAPELEGYSLQATDFSRFRVLVYTTIANVPGLDSGSFLILMTSPERIDDVPQREPFGDGIASHPPEKLPELLMEWSRRMAVDLVARHCSKTSKAHCNKMIAHRVWFYADRSKLLLDGQPIFPIN